MTQTCRACCCAKSLICFTKVATSCAEVGQGLKPWNESSSTPLRLYLYPMHFTRKFCGVHLSF